MRCAILSDIHSNLEALQAVAEVCQAEKVEAFFCSGDIVGYGANPNECIDLIRQLRVQCVAGNHDWGVSGKVDLNYFNPEAKEAILWTRKNLVFDYFAWLDDLKAVFKNAELMLVHGDLDAPSLFDYLKDIDHAAKTFSLMSTQVCFVGHTHVPRIFIQDQNKTFESNDFSFQLNPSCKYIVNAGSVGQPRDNNPMASFCLYDTDKETLQIRRVAYDVKSAADKILKAGLPDMLSYRLSVGY